MSFDALSHYRKKAHREEARADALDHVRRRLERLLAITLKVAVGNDCDPLALLAVLEDIDRRAQQPGASIDALAQLLRETNPAPRQGEAAAA